MLWERGYIFTIMLRSYRIMVHEYIRDNLELTCIVLHQMVVGMAI